MIIRPRRLRRTSTIRDMVRETNLSVKDFICPLFVRHGRGVKDPIPSMPGQYHFSPDTVLEEVRGAMVLGVPAVILFGLPEWKDPEGSSSWAEDGVVQRAISGIKKAFPISW